MDSLAERDELKKDDHGAMFWKVQLSREESDADRHFGLVLRVREGNKCLVVGSVAGKSGPLARWNEARPDAKVCKGDRVLSVNGKELLREMMEELRALDVQVRLARYPDVFEVFLEKTPEMKLGFKFAEPKRAGLHELRINEVHESADYCLGKHNAIVQEQGMHHMVVSAGMRVVAVNEVSGDCAAMRKELQRAKAVRLKIRRRAAEDDNEASSAGAQHSAAAERWMLALAGSSADAGRPPAESLAVDPEAPLPLVSPAAAAAPPPAAAPLGGNGVWQRMRCRLGFGSGAVPVS
eukprot:TRINITY_DN4144_c0_g1_i3.p1 TRINITY_DN4144_c0_g1~~TRINITY_DN4144_c0_g1_i3.p1  ORF type:complete len:294 (-),score=90.62 TRINITY_DN4144_c0_g1_i3:96-977(-)